MLSFKNYKTQKSFKQYTSESRGLLDLRVQHASKYLSDDSKKDTYLKSPLIIEQKTNGTKINILKIQNTGIAEKDYIVSKNNNIIYPDEFNYTTRRYMKESNGDAQLGLIWEHLFRLRKNDIPLDTELFVEFIPNGVYDKSHDMILIGHSDSTHEIKNGKLLTKPDLFKVNERNKYATEMNFNTPNVLFMGIIGNRNDFNEGIISPDLKSLYRDSDIKWDNPEVVVESTKSMFLKVPSRYGGQEKGIVVKYDNSGVIMKWQNNQETKSLTIVEDTIDAEVVTQVLNQNKPQKSRKQDFRESILRFNTKLKSLNISEPLKEQAASEYKKRLSKDVSNSAIMIGEFRIFTKADYDIIKEALANYDTVTIGLISSKRTKGSKHLRNEMVEKLFGSKIEIINSSSSNIHTLLEKSINNITTVITKPTETEKYKDILSETYGVNVYESDIDGVDSADLIAHIDNKELFKKNTSNKLYELYEQVKELYS